MRPTLTVASSLTPHLPWWRHVPMPSSMVGPAMARVLRNIAQFEPCSGVAVVVRMTDTVAP